MEIENLRNLIKEYDSLLAENKNLKSINEMQHQQLAIIAANSGGRLTGIKYDNLNELDWEKINVGIGMDTLSVSDNHGKPIKSYDEFPKRG